MVKCARHWKMWVRRGVLYSICAPLHNLAPASLINRIYSPHVFARPSVSADLGFSNPSCSSLATWFGRLLMTSSRRTPSSTLQRLHCHIPALPPCVSIATASAAHCDHLRRWCLWTRLFGSTFLWLGPVPTHVIRVFFFQVLSIARVAAFNSRRLFLAVLGRVPFWCSSFLVQIDLVNHYAN